MSSRSSQISELGIKYQQVSHKVKVCSPHCLSFSSVLNIFYQFVVGIWKLKCLYFLNNWFSFYNDQVLHKMQRMQCSWIWISDRYATLRSVDIFV